MSDEVLQLPSPPDPWAPRLPQGCLCLCSPSWTSPVCSALPHPGPGGEGRAEDETPQHQTCLQERTCVGTASSVCPTVPVSPASSAARWSSASVPVLSLPATSVMSCMPWAASHSVTSALYPSGLREWGLLARTWSLSPWTSCLPWCRPTHDHASASAPCPSSLRCGSREGLRRAQVCAQDSEACQSAVPSLGRGRRLGK